MATGSVHPHCDVLGGNSAYRWDQVLSALFSCCCNNKSLEANAGCRGCTLSVHSGGQCNVTCNVYILVTAVQKKSYSIHPSDWGCGVL